MKKKISGCVVLWECHSTRQTRATNWNMLGGKEHEYACMLRWTLQGVYDRGQKRHEPSHKRTKEQNIVNKHGMKRSEKVKRRQPNETGLT